MAWTERKEKDGMDSTHRHGLDWTIGNETDGMERNGWMLQPPLHTFPWLYQLSSAQSLIVLFSDSNSDGDGDGDSDGISDGKHARNGQAEKLINHDS